MALSNLPNSKLVFFANSSVRTVALSFAPATLFSIFLYWTHVDLSIVLLWFSAYTLTNAARLIDYRRIIKNNDSAVTQLSFKQHALIFTSGSLWSGGYLLCLPHADLAFETMVILMIAGNTASAIYSLAAFRSAYLAFALPMMIPPLIYNIYASTAANGRWFITFLILGFTVLTLTIARYITEMMDAVFRLTKEKDELLEEQKQLIQKLGEISITDALTGLFNRRNFDTTLQDEINRAKRDGHPLSLLSIDLDHFKAVSDTLGHLMGDQLLKLLADCMRQSFRRSGDILFRLGGDEFYVILTNTNLDAAEVAAKKLKQFFNLSHIVREIQNYPSTRSLGVSIGLLYCSPEALEAYQTLDFKTIQFHADKALYIAKESGKNKLGIIELANELKSERDLNSIINKIIHQSDDES